MVSYAVTVYNEINEIKKLVTLLQEYISEDDEIVIQMDTKATDEVKEYVGSLDVKSVLYDLNNNFAEFKNNLTKQCTKEWILQLDADEQINPILIINLHQILEMNKDLDLILVPRINTVEGLTDEDIRKWGWRVNDKGHVNFPDFQFRLFRNNGKILWIHPVHEILSGYEKMTKLPIEEEYCLLHPKTIDRQRKQNEFYQNMFR